jgi:hypothetical protein
MPKVFSRVFSRSNSFSEVHCKPSQGAQKLWSSADLRWLVPCLLEVEDTWLICVGSIDKAANAVISVTEVNLARVPRALEGEVRGGE